MGRKTEVASENRNFVERQIPGKVRSLLVVEGVAAGIGALLDTIVLKPHEGVDNASAGTEDVVRDKGIALTCGATTVVLKLTDDFAVNLLEIRHVDYGF